MRNIKTFSQLFENESNKQSIKVVVFRQDDSRRFSKYINSEDHDIREFDIGSIYDTWIRKYGDVYIVDDDIIFFCHDPALPGPLEIANGLFSTGLTEKLGERGTARFNSMNQLIDKLKNDPMYKKYSRNRLKAALILADMTQNPKQDRSFTMQKAKKNYAINVLKDHTDLICDYITENPDNVENIVDNMDMEIFERSPILRKNIVSYMADYYKKNPLDLYKIDKYPNLKKDVLLLAGIKDYGSIGRKLKSGMM